MFAGEGKEERVSWMVERRDPEAMKDELIIPFWKSFKEKEIKDFTEAKKQKIELKLGTEIIWLFSGPFLKNSVKRRGRCSR